MRSGGREVAVDEDNWWGTRDRSWGIRPIGERETGGAPAMPGGFYWLWAPLNFDDACYLFDVNEYPDGSRWHESAMVASPDVHAAVESGRAEYSFTLRSGTRHASAAELSFEFPSGKQRITLTPLYNFYMQGIGYAHPTWGHAMWVGENERTYDSVITAQENEADFTNLHIQAICRAERDDGAVGTGILEQLIAGPSATLGLRELFDMAP